MTKPAKVRASIALAHYLEPTAGKRPPAVRPAPAPPEPELIYVIDPYWRRQWFAALFTALGFLAGVHLFT